MVFGIEDKSTEINSDLIPYQKFYQRVVKETGIVYERFFDQEFDISKGIPKIVKNIIIFGHSVDPLDKEILQIVLNWLTINITKVDLYLHILMKQLNVQ